MEPENVYHILLVRAVEEGDPRGESLPFASREGAALRARDVNEPSDPGPDAALRPQDWDFLAHRASYLASPAAGIAKVAPNPPSLYPAAVIGLGLAFLLGAASHTAGLTHHFHLFWGPFLPVLLWNVVVVGILGFRFFKTKGTTAPPPWLARKLVRGLTWWQDLSVGGHEAPASSRAFLVRWLDATAPALKSKTTASIHGASVAFALGLVVSVYARGVSSQYLAGWESTWLEAKHVRLLLGTVLHPASAITGIAMPTEDLEWEQMRFSGGTAGVPAGPWIHLHAVTLLLFAVLPRLCLAWVAWVQGQRLGRQPPPWPPGDGYARRLLRGATSGPHRIAILPYGFKNVSILNQAGTKAAIARLCAEVWGREAVARWHEPIVYDGEIPKPDTMASTSGVLFLFDIHATPEDEVHGEAVATARRLYQGHSLLVAIETAEFPEERIAVRLSAWSEMSRRLHIHLVTLGKGVPLDTSRLPSDHLLQL